MTITPTDGDPHALGDLLRNSGVHIACAFVTDRDVHTPRTLPCKAEGNWPSGARLLFDMASPIESAANDFVSTADDWRGIFENSGWEAPAGARLFIQVNHSETLADFMRIVATAFPAREVLRALRHQK